MTAWKVGDGAERYPELAGRVSLNFQSGSASLSIRPTRAEAFQLITLLEWALDLGVFQVLNSPAAAASETAGARP